MGLPETFSPELVVDGGIEVFEEAGGDVAGDFGLGGGGELLGGRVGEKRGDFDGAGGAVFGAAGLLLEYALFDAGKFEGAGDGFATEDDAAALGLVAHVSGNSQIDEISCRSADCQARFVGSGAGGFADREGVFYFLLRDVEF